MMKVIATGALALALVSSGPAWASGKGLRLPTGSHHHHHHHHHHSQVKCYWDHYNQICVPRGT